MKTLQLQKRIAASVLKVGLNKVWFDPTRISEIREAITREDVKELIKEKVIKKKPVKGVKRRAGKKRQKRKKKAEEEEQEKRKKLLKKEKKNI